MHAASPPGTTVDPAEVERFARMATDWWSPTGDFKPLHRMNPARLAAIRDAVAAHWELDPAATRPLAGRRVLDVGCGGGILAEPMARLGAAVVGIDPSATNIGIARVHARQSGLAIDYREATAEELAAAGERFDLVLAMEVVEHVADVPLFLRTVAALVAPGGLAVVSTINRTAKAYALAIVAAERILRWLPVGTHRYDRLVTPEEIERPFAESGLAVTERAGFAYDPFGDRWLVTRDLGVNYMVVAARPAAG